MNFICGNIFLFDLIEFFLPSFEFLNVSVIGFRIRSVSCIFFVTQFELLSGAFREKNEIMLK